MEWTPPFTGVGLLAKSERAILPAHAMEAAMKITTIGLDLAKNVFQVHGVDETALAPSPRYACQRLAQRNLQVS